MKKKSVVMTLYELDFYLSVSFFGKEFIGKKRVSVCQEIKDSSLWHFVGIRLFCFAYVAYICNATIK